MNIKVNIEQKISLTNKAFHVWKNTTFNTRKKILKKVAYVLREDKERLAEVIHKEMYKDINDAKSEIEKCAWVCEYYADNAQKMLEDQIIETEATKSLITNTPLGIIFAIMPWNFPFWQVFRFASPALMAGNSCILKHASNVSICAMEIEKIFLKANLPKNVFTTLLVSSKNVEDIIKNENVRAITLTGSEEAGKNVAQIAGKYLKKVVLELGGSDPFIVFPDSDIKKAANAASVSRMIVTGQSCIAAKRFIVHKSIKDKFIKLLNEELDKIEAKPLISEVACKTLKNQVQKSIKMGATIYPASQKLFVQKNIFEPVILTRVSKKMPVWQEETFGPVLPIMTFENEDEAIDIANDSKYGLGASLWTKNRKRIDYFIKHLDAGTVFVNAFVKSDPRLPFGGIKSSGYGRELSSYGIKEFVNIKSVWIN